MLEKISHIKEGIFHRGDAEIAEVKIILLSGERPEKQNNPVSTISKRRFIYFRPLCGNI